MSEGKRYPKKVLHVLNSASGGAALSTISLVKMLRKEGIESCAVCHPSGSEVEQQLLLEAFDNQVQFTTLYWWNKKIRSALWKRPFHELRQRWQTGNGIKSMNAVKQFAIQQQVDLIHTNTILTPEGGKVAKALSLPHIWHVRELIGVGRPFLLAQEGNSLDTYLVNHSSRLVANSHITAETLGASLRDHVQVVPNGIELDKFINIKKIERQKLIVAMVANLTSRCKNHSLFVQAAAQVNVSLAIEFRIYGTDPSQSGVKDTYAEEIHQQIELLNLDRRFACVGYVSSPVQIMEGIDILVHPTQHESFGRILVEAMAAEIPVIGVNDGGASEIVQHGKTGYLVAPNDDNEMAKRIEELVQNSSLRKEFGQAGRAHAEANYSMTKYKNGILDAYQFAMDHPVSN